MDQPKVTNTEISLSFSNLSRQPEENRSKVVIVVDDDHEMLALVSGIGRKAGYTVFGVSSGEECLAMLWRVTPQLILLDVRMRGLDGFETCRRVRNDPNVAHVPIGFLTARKSVEDLKRGLAAGADDFIVKPFDGPQLIERIEALVADSNAKRNRRSAKSRLSKELEEAPIVPTGLVSENAPAPEASMQPDIRAAAYERPRNDEKSTTNTKPGMSKRERFSLRQIVATPLRPFLMHSGHQKAPGLIPTAVLPYWWEALMATAREQLKSIQGDLDRLMPLDDVLGLESLSQTLRGVVATMTGHLSTLLVDTKAAHPPAVKALAGATTAAQMKLISEILLVAGPLHEAIDTFNDAVGREAKDKKTIVELSPALVGVAKKCYARLGEGGIAGRLFVMALLNRLEKPWQIFRLTLALSWNRDAAVVSGTELSVIGDYVIFVLNEFVSAVDAATTKIAAGAEADFAALQSLIKRYADADAGFVGEIDVRRDTAWGTELSHTRMKMCKALELDRLRKIGDAILAPIQVTGSSSWAIGSAALDDETTHQREKALATAAAAVAFLNFTAQTGEKAGFGGPARRLLEANRGEVTDKIEAMLEKMRRNKLDGVAPAQVEQAIRLVEILFTGNRKNVLVKRLTLAIEGC